MCRWERRGKQVIESANREINLPSSIHASFQGTAAAFQDSLANEPILILAALLPVYIVLGVLYESYIHPITILSTLPSAGVGAILALLIFKKDLNVIALIGVLLFIGIVKKNAIMMIDFALHVERTGGKSSEEAIYEACVLRFRPIMMTTMAALLAGLPLALGTGTGSELHRPLGITIVGGLIVSQILTLFTTPVVYLYLDRLPEAGVRGSAEDANGERYQRRSTRGMSGVALRWETERYAKRPSASHLPGLPDPGDHGLFCRPNYKRPEVRVAAAQRCGTCAAIGVACAVLFPTITGTATCTGARQSLNRSGTPQNPSNATRSDYQFPIDTSYELSVWGTDSPQYGDLTRQAARRWGLADTMIKICDRLAKRVSTRRGRLRPVPHPSPVEAA